MCVYIIRRHTTALHAGASYTRTQAHSATPAPNKLCGVSQQTHIKKKKGHTHNTRTTTQPNTRPNHLAAIGEVRFRFFLTLLVDGVRSTDCGWVNSFDRVWVCGRNLAFTRYCFTSSRECTNQSSFYSSGPPALPTLLQYYCTAIGQYPTPHPTPLVHAIHIQYWQWQYRVKATPQRPPSRARATSCRTSS